MLNPNAEEGPPRDPRLVRAICILALVELAFFACVALILVLRSRHS